MPTSNNTPADPADLGMVVFTNNHTQITASFSQMHWVAVDDPSSPVAGTYLAVCGADRKSDVGGDHHCERGGQLNGEAAAGGGTRDTSQALFVSASLTPQGCQSLTRTFFGSIVSC